MSKLSTSYTSHPDYDEREALQTLYDATEEMLQDVIDHENDDNYIEPNIIITVAGISVALYAGGVQATGIHALIESISGENCYTIDYKE